MPRYEPPPPYEGRQKANAEQAARLLCEIMAPIVRDRTEEVPSPLLEWFVEHRQIDLEMMKYQATAPDAMEAELAQRDIKIATELMEQAKD